jgi:hypothetical protein
VERVTFHNPDNGFCVLRVKARGKRELVTVVGHAAMAAAGEFVQMSGAWVNDRVHGQQLARPSSRPRHLGDRGPRTAVNACPQCVVDRGARERGQERLTSLEARYRALEDETLCGIYNHGEGVIISQPNLPKSTRMASDSWLQ